MPKKYLRYAFFDECAKSRQQSFRGVDTEVALSLAPIDNIYGFVYCCVRAKRTRRGNPSNFPQEAKFADNSFHKQTYDWNH